MSKFFTVRKVLTLFLVLSVIFAAFSAYYKIKYWGFDFRPNRTTKVWNIDANITFDEFILEAGKHSAKILMTFLEKLA